MRRSDTPPPSRSPRRPPCRRAPSSVVPDAVTMSSPICSCECRDLREPEHGGRIVGQHEIAAVVRAVHDRLHAGAGHLRRRVDVRDETDRRHVRLARGRGNRRHHVAVLVHRRVRRARGRAARRRARGAAPAASRCSETSSSARPTACRSGRSGGSVRGRVNPWLMKSGTELTEVDGSTRSQTRRRHGEDSSATGPVARNQATFIPGFIFAGLSSACAGSPAAARHAQLRASPCPRVTVLNRLAPHSP